MKQVNLISFIDAYRNLSEELFTKYKEYYSINFERAGELECLSDMIDTIKTINQKVEIFDRFFIGFKIPQIGKEFDLLRLDGDSIVNIELKKESTEEKIKEQLEKNKYYLSFLDKKLFCFTYVSSENKFYELGQNNNLNEVSTREVVSKLIAQNPYTINDIKSFFNPSDYLVSPFNSTDKFIKGYYFLTEHQKNIKSQVLKEIEKPDTAIISIKGKAGTGKTLLIYDIAKEIYNKDENILIIHCGYLNEGQNLLIGTYNWNIIPIKEALQQDFSKYKLVIIDETQRIYPSQFYSIIEKVKQNNSNCIISFDGKQTLHNWEEKNNIPQKVDEIKTHSFELTDKIRTNKDVADFIRMLFNRNIPYSEKCNADVEITYFSDLEKMKDFLNYLKIDNEWEIINYTPQRYGVASYEKFMVSDQLNSHKVIGQEFNNVVAVIDEYFFYENGMLETKGTYWYLVKMLYQIVTRARLKIHLVIYKNQEILERCLQILK